MKPKRGGDTEIELDRQVAARIRALRLAAGLNQQQLGERLGVTFQQMQKYEKGRNRLTAGKLILLADVFGIPVAQLLADRDEIQRPNLACIVHADEAGGLPFTQREAMQLMTAYASIRDVRKRKHILALIKHLSDTAAKGPGVFVEAA